jgi:hypothetical protein
MSYIGSPPASQAFAAGTDTFSGTGSQVAFSLSRNVTSPNDILVVINNVEQDPVNYTVAGNILTMTAAPSSGTNNMYVRFLSTNLTTIGVNQRAIGVAQLSATGTPSATTYLRGDNTWTAVSAAEGDIFYINGKIVTQNYTITSTENAMSSGPITVADGVTVTIEDGGEWAIV